MKPFDFQKQWGMLGAWPGILSIVGAQGILQKIASFKPGAKIVQLGFDGGRATIVAGWAAGSNGHRLAVVGQPSPDMQSEVWFNRAIHLWNMRTFCERIYDCEPFECDMIISNQYEEFFEEWAEHLRIGGSLCLLGNASLAPFNNQDFTKIADAPGQVALWDRNVITRREEPQHKDNVIVMPERNGANGHAPGPLDAIPLPIELPEVSVGETDAAKENA